MSELVTQPLPEVQSDNWYWKAAAIAILALPLFRLALFLVFTLIKQLLPMPDLVKKYTTPDQESWAVVTGATDGIGLGFCQVLTKLGFNVLLISRNAQKLAKVIQDLQKIRPKQYSSAKFKSIVFDFKNSGQGSEWQALLQQLRGLDIAMLVNNVGIGIAKYYHTHTQLNVNSLITVNCLAMAALLPPVLEGMIKRKTKSAIINLSSYQAEKTLPLLSLYSATKAFNMKLSEGLAYEYPQIDVFCLKPMYVESNLSRQKKGFMIPDAYECAWDSLKELRWSRESYGYYSHRINRHIFLNLVPDFVYNLYIRFFAKESLIRTFKLTKVQ